MMSFLWGQNFKQQGSHMVSHSSTFPQSSRVKGSKIFQEPRSFQIHLDITKYRPGEFGNLMDGELFHLSPGQIPEDINSDLCDTVVRCGIPQNALET